MSFPPGTGAAPRWLEALRQVAEAEPEREACGLLFRERSGEVSVEPVENVADRFASSEPERFPGGSRKGYVLAPRGLREALSAASRRGAQLDAVYHSHPDGPALLSPRDVAEALADGVPALPGVEQVVVALRHGRAVAARRFRWNGAAFEEAPLARGGAQPAAD